MEALRATRLGNGEMEMTIPQAGSPSAAEPNAAQRVSYPIDDEDFRPGFRAWMLFGSGLVLLGTLSWALRIVLRLFLSPLL